MIKTDRIAKMLREGIAGEDPLIIAPTPNLDELEKSGSASVDLRLGTWFLMLRHARSPILDVAKEGEPEPNASSLAKMHYVPLGEQFVLHPTSFVLAVTLEWIRMSKKLGGYVTSKSSWGRRGLIIATATGVHPGFTGCLTLELRNVGEMPIALYPGMTICQFFLHTAETESVAVDASKYVVKRRPVLGSISFDAIAQKLRKNS